MDLNLTTGRNLPTLKARGRLPNWVLNTREYTQRPGWLINRITERFHSVYGDCFVPQDLRIEYYSGGAAMYFFSDVYNTDRLVPEALPPPAEQVIGCLTKSRAVKLIAIPIHLQDYREDDTGHAQLLIINKVYRTVELYDSNGSEGIPRDHMDYIKDICKDLKWPLSKYTFVPVNWTNPPLGLQIYQDMGTESCYSIGGFCAIWVFYYAELRAQQVNDSPRTFRRKMTRRLKKIAAAGIPLGEYFRDVILDYLEEMSNL